jgi:hypothetical protein
VDVNLSRQFLYFVKWQAPAPAARHEAVCAGTYVGASGPCSAQFASFSSSKHCEFIIRGVERTFASLSCASSSL